MNKELVRFFSGNFHQDWGLEATTDKEVVEAYKELVPPERAVMISELIERELLMGPLSDDELGEVLYSGLGCHFDPSSTHPSVRHWLEGLIRHLRTTS